jgi:hypothetical protein
VNTIIWSAPRVGEVKELSLVRDQLAVKYGKEFMMQALENQDERVDPKVKYSSYYYNRVALILLMQLDCDKIGYKHTRSLFGRTLLGGNRKSL